MIEPILPLMNGLLLFCINFGANVKAWEINIS